MGKRNPDITYDILGFMWEQGEVTHGEVQAAMVAKGYTANQMKGAFDRLAKKHCVLKKPNQNWVIVPTMDKVDPYWQSRIWAKEQGWDDWAKPLAEIRAKDDIGPEDCWATEVYRSRDAKWSVEHQKWPFEWFGESYAYFENIGDKEEEEWVPVDARELPDYVWKKVEKNGWQS